MKEAMLYDRKDKKRVVCRVCPWRCSVVPGRAGRCCIRTNKDGKLYAQTYSKVSSVAADPIEKKPLFHFHPGSAVFSIGSIGCNMRCIHCQNWQIAHAKPEDIGTEGLMDLSPELAVKSAKADACEGVAWTYNEPTIWIEYTLESMQLCKAEGLYTVYVTNGYTTIEALDKVGPFLDAYCVDIKGFTKEFYNKLANISDFSPILKATSRAKDKWGMHIEVVTNIIPGWNDDEPQLEGIASWISKELGENTPWHVTRFIPHLELMDAAPTPVKTLENARQIGQAAGLKFVYIGNVPGHPGEDTYCPGCGQKVIQRAGYNIGANNVDSGKCSFCGDDLGVIA